MKLINIYYWFESAVALRAVGIDVSFSSFLSKTFPRFTSASDFNYRALPGRVIIDFIPDERARELCGEQPCWFDLKRTGKLVNRVRNLNPDAAGFILSTYNLRPIPQSRLDAVTNKTAFTPNRGYQ